MRKCVMTSVAGCVLCAGSALGTPTTGDDWRSEWRAQRNATVQLVPGLPFDPTSVLVRFRPGVDAKAIDAVKAAAGLRAEPIETWKLVPRLEHLKIDQGAVKDALTVLLQNPAVVEFAEPDYLGNINATPNDTFYNLQWGINNTGQTVAGNDRGSAGADIDGNLAWDTITGGSFVVGMADSGIRRTHQDLDGNIWTNPGEVAGNGIDDDGNGRTDDTWGWDFWNNDNNPTDDNGHGTHTAGTVGAEGNNGVGVAGVCWTVRLAGLKIGSASGSVSVSAAIGATDYCVGKGIKLANHSWGGGASSSSFSAAISNAQAAGHMLICAAGNGGPDGRGDNNNTLPQYPASYPQDNIIAVAATDNDDKLARYSNYGSTSVDLGAPGSNVASCGSSSDSAYVYMSGTSMATPHVTGACALVWMRNPTWTYAQVRSRILSTTRPTSALSGKCVTGGVLNARNAVQ